MGLRAQDRQALRSDDTPVSGGLQDISRFLIELPEPTIGVVDDLTREILTILALNPDIRSKYWEADIAVMDDATKRQLLADIRKSLGIKPLRKYQL